MSEEILFYVVPAIVFVMSATLAFVMGKRRSSGGLIAQGALILGTTVLMFVGMNNATGWDGLGYAIALAGLCVPSGAGYVIGGIAGWIRGDRTLHA